MIALQGILLSHGLSDLEANLWGQFIGAVLEALANADTLLNSSAEWRAFCKKKGAFGKRRKNGPLKGCRIPTEEALSAELADRMHRYITTSTEFHVLKKLYVMFDCEARLPNKKRTGKHSSRGDIRARSGRHEELQFILEAKVIELESQIDARLLGDDGMGCFTRSDPYSISPVAGLIAYVVEHDPVWWLQRIAGALPARKATRVAQSVLHPGRPAVLASVPRQGRGPLAVVGLAMVYAAG